MKNLRASSALGVILVTACSWTRFDDVSENPPVVLLERPSGSGPGFGSSITSLSLNNEVRVLVGATPGAQGASEFAIGTGQSPGSDAIAAGHCAADQGCVMAAQPAALRTAQTGAGVRQLCYAEGHRAAGSAWSVLIHCEGDGPGDLVLADWLFPASVKIDQPERQRLSLASEPDADDSRLLAGLWATDLAPGTAFLYRPGAIATPEVLAPASTGPSYGSSVAIVRAGNTYLAVGEPGAGRVYLYRDDGGSAPLVGCVQRGGGFGLSLAAGPVSAGAGDDLVIGDGVGAHVVDGGALASFGSGSGCAPDLPQGSLVVSLGCRETADVSGCPGGFGTSVAVADIDRDGDGEVIVGAPGMRVRDESSAGAVLVYDVEPEHPDWLAEAKFISSRESGDRLGASLAIVRQPDRDIYVAGAPGGAKAAVFLCSKLLPAAKRGAHCE